MRQFVLIALLTCCLPAAAEDRSSDFTDPWQVYAYELLRDSVAFRSVRGEKQVLPFAEYLASQFLDNGFAAEDVRLLAMDSAGEPSASLVVRYRGSSDKKAILLAAHMDVVAATGAGWGRDPFVLNEDNGFYFGRGVLDDKFGTTVLTSTFLRLRQEEFVPERDLIIAFTGDEETNQLTIEALVRDHFDLIDAEVAFSLDFGLGRLNEKFEPVAAFLQFAEKTYATFEITAFNPGGHSSKPRRDNAIFDLADAIKAIQNYEFPIRTSEGNRRYFAAMGTVVKGDMGAAMRRFADDMDDKEATDLLSADPEYVGIIRTTCVPTILRGGHVENALPETATVTVQCRVFPGIDVDEVESRLATTLGNPDLEIKRTWDPTTSLPSPIRGDVLELVQAAYNPLYPDILVVPYPAPYTTDGVFLRNAGITTYGLMGMFMRAEDDFAHSSNEKLPVKGFYEALDFWYGLAKEVSAL